MNATAPSLELELSPALCAKYAATRPVRGTCRIILDYIARRMNWDGPRVGSAHLCLETIAEQARVCIRTAQRHIAQLIEMGEIERESHSYANGVQCSNLWRVPGLLTFAAKPSGQPQTPEITPTKLSPHPDKNVAPISPDSSSPQNTPPTPEAEPKPSSRFAQGRRRKENPTPEEEAENAKLGTEAAQAYAELAQPTWTPPQDQDRESPNWLGARVKKLGGLQEWRKILSLAATSRWINAQEGLGMSFFSAHKPAAAIRAGLWGVKLPKPPPPPVQHDLVAKPWLALLDDLPRLSREVSYTALQDGIYEGKNLAKAFGVHAEAYAVWRILHPQACAAWRAQKAGKSE